MAFEHVKECLENTAFKRVIEGEIIQAADLIDGAVAKNPVGYYHAFTPKASKDDVVIVLNNRDDGSLTYEGEYQKKNGAWVQI